MARSLVRCVSRSQWGRQADGRGRGAVLPPDHFFPRRLSTAPAARLATEGHEERDDGARLDASGTQ